MFKAFRLGFVFICCIGFIHDGFSTSWPVFAVPDKVFLQAEGIIETGICPRGSGSLKSGERINIWKKLCKTYCSDDWEWVMEGGPECLDLEKDFELLRIDVTHFQDDDGTTSHSQVVGVYGNKESGIEKFRATLLTNPGDHWYCVVSNFELGFITCANDI